MSCCVLRGLSRQKVGTDWLCWDGGWLKSLRNLLSRDGYYQTSSDITKIWQGSRIKWKRIKWTKYWLPGISTNVSEMQLNTLLRQNIGVIPKFTSRSESGRLVQTHYISDERNHFLIPSSWKITSLSVNEIQVVVVYLRDVFQCKNLQSLLSVQSVQGTVCSPKTILNFKG